MNDSRTADLVGTRYPRRKTHTKKNKIRCSFARIPEISKLKSVSSVVKYFSSKKCEREIDKKLIKEKKNTRKPMPV